MDNEVPAVAALYQVTVPPAGAVADRMTEPAPHFDAATPTGAVGNGFTVTKSAVLVADTQPVRVFIDSA